MGASSIETLLDCSEGSSSSSSTGALMVTLGATREAPREAKTVREREVETSGSRALLDLFVTRSLLRTGSEGGGGADFLARQNTKQSAIQINR